MLVPSRVCAQNAFLGGHGVISMATLAMAMRLYSYYTLYYLPSVWFVLPVELLHGETRVCVGERRGVTTCSGITFAAMWSACVAYGTEIAPLGYETSAPSYVGVFVEFFL
jgi:hypothetical protein